ncbi:MAG: hypothetical protein AAF682_11560 [Planctomycetota bacterium]
MRYRSVLGAFALGVLSLLALPAPAQGGGDVEPLCLGCTGEGGGDSEFRLGNPTKPDLYFRIDMEKPVDGVCAGPFYADFELTCLEAPCFYSAITCWVLPEGVAGTQTITGESIKHIFGTECDYPQGLIPCGDEMSIEIAAGGNSIHVGGSCSDCTY